MTGSCRTDLNNNNITNDETRNIDNIENDSFSALKTNYDRGTHTHQSKSVNSIVTEDHRPRQYL